MFLRQNGKRIAEILHDQFLLISNTVSQRFPPLVQNVRDANRIDTVYILVVL